MKPVNYPECFESSATADWICKWWDHEQTDIGVDHFCSRPDWDYRECPGKGLKPRKQYDRDSEDFAE